MPPFFLNGLAKQSQASPSCDEPPTNLKVMVGVKASNGNHGQSGGPGRGLWRDDGERAPPGGSAEAGAAATGKLDNGERAPPGGSAEARAAAINERYPTRPTPDMSRGPPETGCRRPCLRFTGATRCRPARRRAGFGRKACDAVPSAVVLQ